MLARYESLLRRLSSRRAAVWMIVVATALAATSVGPHRALDDFVLSLIARGDGAAVGLVRHPLDLFTFTNGVAADNRRLMDHGLMLPWWTDPELHIAFLRPVSSFTHYVDELLFPAKPVLMHLHSLLWFAAMLAAAGLLYLSVEAPATAGLSLLLYAIDDAHGPPLAWLANRNALIATCFGCLTLAFHDGWRRRNKPGFLIAALASFVLGLLAGELAVGAVAYLVAYAVCREGGPLARRALSLAPYGAVVVVWRVVWTSTGFGAHGSGAYIDPLRHTVDFLTVTPARVLVLLQAQFAGPPADLAFLGRPPDVPAFVLMALVATSVVTWLVVPILRRDAHARFWALGMLLAVLPLSATFPSDRLLLFVGLGGSALVARLIDTWVRAWLETGRPSVRSVFAALFAAEHLLLSPVLLAARSAQMELFGVAADRSVASLPAAASMPEKTVVIIASPMLLFSSYIPAEQRVHGLPYAARQYVLASASSKIQVSSAGPHSLIVRPEHGFLYSPLERHYRGGSPFEAGQEVRLAAMTATIVAVEDARPSAVRFDFPASPESYVFVTWKDGRYVPFEVPPAGQAAALPEEDFGQILGRTLGSLLSGQTDAP